jgi:hypothetical protein
VALRPEGDSEGIAAPKACTVAPVRGRPKQAKTEGKTVFVWFSALW